MIAPGQQQRAALERDSHILRARERSLQGLAQSVRCTNRAAAEAELCKVREQLASTYTQLRRPWSPIPARLPAR